MCFKLLIVFTQNNTVRVPLWICSHLRICQFRTTLLNLLQNADKPSHCKSMTVRISDITSSTTNAQLWHEEHQNPLGSRSEENAQLSSLVPVSTEARQGEVGRVCGGASEHLLVDRPLVSIVSAFPWQMNTLKKTIYQLQQRGWRSRGSSNKEHKACRRECRPRDGTDQSLRW